ncbi:modification methylase [Hydrococcus rivularis NIES-593]|uniref:site-specific DNA-methyltransferase (adenine-specific) n=1 Tax=Hydrococcus rivularis NIES-593 TaxID=1921803 RepID=A0A1U7H8F9_9CYAN|nr:DNA adenine methylase [Hydrococcus rivularis]OKH19463.1 modification methylase [Hydrococcus rivularis NIES-593]
MSSIKSPLRYPGGKSRAINKIIPHIPLNITEYREPFVGGGSVFLAIKQLFGARIKLYWINDLNYDLCCFWTYARDELESLVDAVTKIKHKYTDGRELFNYYTREDLKLSNFDRAVRFFVLNRITFSGTVDSGGYSQQAFERRFTDSSIDRLRKLSSCLLSTHITASDYEKLLFQDGDGVFIFLDPPYFSAKKSKLYGIKGALHTSFDHQRFATNMRKCQHRWLITYDDSPEIRELFSFAKIAEWTLQYGMNNYKQEFAAEGQELLIKNY